VGAAPRERGRPFRPHLTLARSRVPLALPVAFTDLAAGPPFDGTRGVDGARGAAWTARELLLIESRLDRTGPERYPVLVRHALGPR
jgi:2'-5' RNA ligase